MPYLKIQKRQFLFAGIRIAVMLILIFLMVSLSCFFQEPELIFPEVAALGIGAWLLDKQPWRVTRTQIILLMGSSALIGVLIVRFLPFDPLWQACIAFCVGSVLIIASQTTLFPVYPACILPVMLGTQTFWYPISVLILSIIIAVGQKLFIVTGLREETCFPQSFYDRKQEAKNAFFRLLMFTVVAAIPFYSGYPYLVAPPLIVIFLEAGNPQGKIRQHPVLTVLLCAISAVCGTAARLFLHETLGIWLPVCAVIAIIGVLVSFGISRFAIPPVGAISLLPMLFPAENLALYPAFVTAGCMIFLLLNRIFFCNRNPTEITDTATS